MVGTRHVDPEDMAKYEVTRIAVTNDKERHIVAYRCPVFFGVLKESQEESVYVRDVEEMYLPSTPQGRHFL